MPSLAKCSRCGYLSSQEICKACVLLEGLNKGLPRLGIGKTSRINRVLNQNKLNSQCCSSSNVNCCKLKNNYSEKDRTCSSSNLHNLK